MGRCDLPAGVDELPGAGRADAAEEALGAAEPGDDPQEHLRLAELGPLRGVDEVARQRELSHARHHAVANS